MGSDNPGGGGTGSTTRWLVVLGIVSLVALLYVLLSGGRASVDRPRLRAPGPDVGPAAAQRQLDEQVQLVYAAQDAAQSCRTQFQVGCGARHAARRALLSQRPSDPAPCAWPRTTRYKPRRR